MAEAAGLVLGVAGLAGLVNACMEAISLFQASRSHGRDFEILMTRLEIEKTLILQWAERVGILGELNNGPGHDPRLNNPRTHSAVANALSCALYLLTDAERLRSDYGVTSSSPALGLAEDVRVMTSDRTGSFANAYRQLQIRMGMRQSAVGRGSRARWAIRDRERFSSLVNELRGFVQSLNDLLPASEQHQRILIQNGIESMAHDMRALRLIQEATKIDHRDWSEAASIRADASEIGTEDVQRIDDWRRDIQELATNHSHDTGLLEQAFSIQTGDPEAFKIAATGPLENLVQICESNLVSVTENDSSGHTLLRYALKDLCIENARYLLINGSDANSMESSHFGAVTDECHGVYDSHFTFLLWEHESCLNNSNLASRPSQAIITLQGLLLQHGADPLRPCKGGALNGRIMFDEMICGGMMQNLLPFYLSKGPSIDLQSRCKEKGYTRLHWACSSLYDPRGFKVSAIRTLIYRGADVRACCEAFGNTTLHLALLSARDEVHVNCEKWKGNSRDLRLILRDLLRNKADVTARNYAGFTPADVAVGLKCAKSWNDAMQDCGLTSHVIDASRSIDAFGEDPSRRTWFEKWWEDCAHFDAWRCRPDSCTLQASCHWWEEKERWDGCLHGCQWEQNFSEWEEL